MKKILLIASALAGLFLAGSCQKETLEPAAKGGVTYEITLPDGPQTKGENGYATYDLHYEVYKTADANALATTPLLFEKTVSMTGNTTTVTLDLLNDQDYTVLFWANKAGENYFDLTDLRQVGVRQAASNNDDRDAFCGMDQLEQHDGAQSKTVELKRPFAQINIATLVNNVDYDINPVSSLVKVSVPVKYNVFTGEPIGELDDVEYTVNTVPTGYLTVNGTDYKKVAMNYALVPATQDNSATVDVYYEINTNNGTVKNTIPNVPVKKNYRTNIIGNLLTSNATYTIEVKPGFEEGDLAPEAIYLAAAIGGEVTLTEDLVLPKPLEVKAKMTINLNGKTISAATEKGNGAVVNISEGVTATLIGGTIQNTTENGDAVINNAGNLVLSGVEIKGAPLADGGYSAYAVISSGYMVIEEGTAISADRGSLKVTGDGETIINGGTFTNNDIGSRSLTSHVVDVEDGSTNKLTINGGTFQHLHTTTSGGVVICNRTRGTVYVNGGNFSGGNYYGNNNLSDYGYGGTFSVKGGVYTAKPAAKYIATGYKAVPIDDKFHVLPEVVADAATAANVTAVTESTADVTTALTTDNGEATMFMWNDVAYIAKYGEVVITSSADDATTARGVVEYAAGLKTATVAEGIEVVGNRTFRKCANLETVVFPSTLTEIGPAVFQSCSKLANVTIPASVTTIGEGAFAECTSLTSINIPDGITRLEKDVLRNTGLTSIEIPASVNYIGTFAFRDCESLTEVTILSPEFTIENNTFTNMAAPVPTMTIYVVNAEMKAYLESVLTKYDKSYITVVAPTTEQYTNPEGKTYTGEAFENPINDALYFNNYFFKGDAAINVTRTYGAIILENCKADINGDLITIDKDNNSVMVLQNLDLTLAEGKKLIKSTKTIYQVFMANITINGVKMTNENIGQYLENVGWYQVANEI